MARIYSCYGMGCSYENSRGECRWRGGNPYPCELEDMDPEDREYWEYMMEPDWEEDRDDG